MKKELEIVPEFEEIPLYEILNPGEIAIGVRENDIFSITTNCITQIFENAGFREINCALNVVKTPNGKELEIVDMYSDGLGNALIVCYKPSSIDVGKNKKFKVNGYLVNHIGNFYNSYTNEWTTVDVRKYVEMYGRNVFLQTIEKIGNILAGKERDLDRMIV